MEELNRLIGDTIHEIHDVAGEGRAAKQIFKDIQQELRDKLSDVENLRHLLTLIERIESNLGRAQGLLSELLRLEEGGMQASSHFRFLRKRLAPLVVLQKEIEHDLKNLRYVCSFLDKNAKVELNISKSLEALERRLEKFMGDYDRRLEHFRVLEHHAFEGTYMGSQGDYERVRKRFWHRKRNW